MSRRKKVWIYGLVGGAFFVVALLLAALALLQTNWFKDKVRARIVSIVEKATGGRVEIGSFDYNWRTLTAEVGPFIVHGKEAPPEAPFFRADRIRIGLKIISALEEKVDIASLSIEKPQLNVLVNAAGETNVPAPKVPRHSKKNFAEQLLDLKVRHFELHNGFARYNSKYIPLDLEADHLEASVVYEANGPRYVGQLSSRQVRVSSPRMKAPRGFDFDARAVLEQNQIQILRASLTNEATKAAISGSISNLSSPRADFNLTAATSLKDLNQTFRLPLESSGAVSFQGKASVSSSPFEYKLEGQLSGRELAYARNDVKVKDIAFASRLDMTPARISLPDLQIFALHGRFRGSAQIADFKKFSVSGMATDFSLQELARVTDRDTGDLSGSLGGTIRAAGQVSPAGPVGLTLAAQLDIVPGTGPVPVQGSVNLNYNQRDGKLQLGDSQVSLGSTNFAVSGTLGEKLAVHLSSRDLNNVLPLLPLLGESPPEQLPIALHGGTVVFDGQVTGPISNPRISGKADATHLALDRREFDHITGTFDVDKTAANIHTLAVEQDGMHLDAHGRIGLVDWRVVDASPVSVSFSVRGADIQRLLAESEFDIRAKGDLSATGQVTGTLESPLVNATVDAGNVTAYDERLDRIHAELTLSATALEVSSLEARSGAARITGKGVYNHLANDWSNGALRGEVRSHGVGLAAINHVQNFRQGLAADMDLQGNGTAKVVNGVVTLTSLNGDLAVKNVFVDGRPYGNLELTASTRLPLLALSAKVDLRGVQLHGSGEWRMEGDYPGQARIQIPRISFATLHDLWPGDHLRKELPFEGFVQGEAAIFGPLNNPAAMKANITLTTVQLNAGPNVRPVGGTAVQDLVLRNAQPVVFQCTTKSIDILSASFTAKGTTLSATGRVALEGKSAWDAAVKGTIDLAILQIFNPDLLASGKSLVSVTIRGPFNEPQVDGRVEVQNASMYIRDLPNGVDQANGLILFDRNRATIQKLTGVTGGGSIEFETGSFVGFRGSALVYRLQAMARQVRYRSPEGFSVTANATLSLIGTSEHSVLSGNVTVIRAAFNPRTDVGSLLASTEQPASMPAPNEYLRGIQFDIGITSSRSLEVETSLTHNIQADANLRLRGTPERQIILGNISVTSGEIEFFGNRYSISRGDVNFYNPARVEPVIDMDLETRVRGIIVDISFSGPLNKLKFSYRSDPPLETNEIIPLLALGRTPAGLSGLAPPPASSTTGLSVSGNTLLSQAISPDTSRLQRFFGVSHIKIDPQLTDITAIPQARLTLEQPVSPNVTLTYITNLARTDEQIVRIEWDLSKKWSAVALRDENGAFSVDFQYRKRFK